MMKSMMCIASCIALATTPLRAQTIHPDIEIAASDAMQNESFGHAVSASTTTIIVGAPTDSEIGFSAGSAYVFDRSNNAQTRKLLAPDGSPLDRFGDAVAINDTTIFISATGQDERTNNAGAVYAFDAITGDFLFKLLPNEGSANALFGSTLAVHDNTLAVGAHRDPTNGVNAGLVYLFNATTGSLIRTLQPSDATAEKIFGKSVAFNDSSIFVGASSDDENGSNNGAVYVFDHNGQQLDKLMTTDPSTNLNFGFAIDADNDRLVVGSPGTQDRGSVYVYDASTLSQLHHLLPHLPTRIRSMGLEVALGGQYIVTAGNPDQALSVPAQLYGAVSGLHLATINNSISPQSDEFGNSIFILGSNLFIGDPHADTNGSNTGVVSIYSHTCAPDFDNNFSLDFFDISGFISAYNNQDPAADFNNDGEFNFFDASAFITQFIQGCP